MTPPHGPSSIEDVRVDIALLGGKIDTLASMIAAQGKASDDHEERLRALECKSTVSAKQLWLAFCAACAIAGALVPFLLFASDLYQHVER